MISLIAGQSVAFGAFKTLVKCMRMLTIFHCALEARHKCAALLFVLHSYAIKVVESFALPTEEESPSCR